MCAHTSCAWAVGPRTTVFGISKEISATELEIELEEHPRVVRRLASLLATRLAGLDALGRDA